MLILLGELTVNQNSSQELYVILDEDRKALIISREAEPLFTPEHLIIFLLLLWGPQRQQEGAEAGLDHPALGTSC